MRTETLDLHHKELLYKRLREVETPVSEYSFPNLYLFRRVHGYEVLFDEDIFIRGKSYDGRTYLMPTRDVRKMDCAYLRDMLETADFLYPIPEEWLGCMREEGFEVTYHPGDSDYVFHADKLRTYAGRRLHKKRNLLRQFTDAYSHDARPLTNELLPDAHKVLRQWQDKSGLPESDTDFHPCTDALNHYEQLVLCGGIYYADGEPAGFALGEEIAGDTFVLHFAKGLTKFKGVYQYIFNTFARVLPEQYTLINIEQDLDMEPLRVAKASYQPDIMLRKARVSLKR